ncbi:MAG: LamG-like jellyroll fold domain-containing protein, partial [Planctomycetota bacterium]
MRFFAGVAGALLLATNLYGQGGAPWQWVLDSDHVSDSVVRAEQGRMNGLAERPLEFDGTTGAARFDGSNSIHIPGLTAQNLPDRQLEVEAWVSIDRGTRYGGIVGYMQDNGNYEKGWILGYNDSRFYFQVSTGTKLLTATSTTSHAKGKWFHLTATYDGAAMRLYVNGAEESSVKQGGRIAYPPRSWFTIGSYRDDNENFRMTGRIRNVRVAGRPSSGAAIAKRYDDGKSFVPKPFGLSRAICVRFLTPSSASLSFGLAERGSARVEYGADTKSFKTVRCTEKGGIHTAVLTGLTPTRTCRYRILAGSGRSPVYELETICNYSVPPVTGGPGAREASDRARQMLEATGIDRGYVLVLGCSTDLAYELARQSRLTVTAVDTSAAVVDRARKRLYSHGVYGSRVTVRHVASPSRLPYRTNSMSLVVADKGRSFPSSAASEAMRVVRPYGAAVLASTSGVGRTCRLSGAPLSAKRAGPFSVVRKGAVPRSGEWTHQYATASNRSCGNEWLGGADATADLGIQWLGRPGSNFGIDRNPRMPAPLAAAGRLFHQGMHRIIALDAYNGAVLWNLEIPELLRVNIPRDNGNWCTDGDTVHVVIKDQLWCVDAATGVIGKTLYLPAAERDAGKRWGYVAQDGGLVFGTS